MLAALACAPMLYACDGLIYDDEGDCTVNYRVKFRYDYNMKFADAFAREVNTVTLYLLDAEGRVVWPRFRRSDTSTSCRCSTLRRSYVPYLAPRSGWR